MSGGHWQYLGFRLQENIESIALDSEVVSRWPMTAQVLERLAPVLYRIEHEMDWDISADSVIENDAAFDAACVAALQAAVVVTP